jgi:phosphatidylinositol-3-phosphatase
MRVAPASGSLPGVDPVLLRFLRRGHGWALARARRGLGSLALAAVLALGPEGASRVADSPSRITAFASPAKEDPPEPARLGHVFLIVLENRAYEDILSNPDAAYLNQLADRYAAAEQFRATAHPSLPNYLALLSGHTYGIRSDCTTCLIDDTSLADELELHSRTWKSYQEDLPSPCFLGSESGGYVMRHNPFLYFLAIRNNPVRCQNVVPLDQLRSDLVAGSVPDLAWITPNLRHDMHDGSIAEGDEWLAGLVPQILASAAWQQNGLLVIVWDEASGGAPDDPDGGHIPALFVSPDLAPGTRSSAPASHYQLLRTIEQAWGLGYLGHTGDPDEQPLTELVPSAAISSATADESR